jgi:hypothetical protein
MVSLTTRSVGPCLKTRTTVAKAHTKSISLVLADHAPHHSKFQVCAYMSFCCLFSPASTFSYPLSSILPVHFAEVGMLFGPKGTQMTPFMRFFSFSCSLPGHLCPCRQAQFDERRSVSHDAVLSIRKRSKEKKLYEILFFALRCKNISRRQTRTTYHVTSNKSARIYHRKAASNCSDSKRRHTMVAGFCGQGDFRLPPKKILFLTSGRGVSFQLRRESYPI